MFGHEGQGQFQQASVPITDYLYLRGGLEDMIGDKSTLAYANPVRWSAPRCDESGHQSLRRVLHSTRQQLGRRARPSGSGSA